MHLLQSKTASKIVADVATYLILSTLSLVILTPVAWMLSTSLKEGGEVFLIPMRWIPQRLMWENYPKALRFIPFGRYFLNTAAITLSCMVGQLLSAPLAAYAFARLRAPGKNALFTLVLATMMIPGQVTMIPLYLWWSRLHAIDTYVPLIVPSFCGGAFYIFLLRQFFLTIPEALGDAARIDGCGHFGVYSRVYLPLSKPAMATVAIFTFMGHWNDFMGPLIYLSGMDKWTLTLGLSRFVDMYGTTTPWHLLMAASLVTVLPCVVLYFFAQTYFIQGIVVTGVKG